LGPSFREMLYHQTQGHPLFTIELLRGLQERGDIIRDSAGCWIEGSSLDWVTLPVRVEAAIQERIGRLPEHCKGAGCSQHRRQLLPPGGGPGQAVENRRCWNT
jgi:hypothetical protein